MRVTIIRCILGIFVAFSVRLSTAQERTMEKTFHEKIGWKAEEYFKDPQVIALCKAVEANDLEEIDRLVKAGADVNARGKDNMTPLLWAFPDGKLQRFTRLLEHGADPNVFTTGDIGTRGAYGAGKSVTHMACGTGFDGYFEAVFQHGGDPNLVAKDFVGFKGTPLFTVISGRGRDKEKRIRRLIELGADLTHVDSGGNNVSMHALKSGGQYRLTLILLELGADHKYVDPYWGGRYRLVHYLLRELRNKDTWTQGHEKDYKKLAVWLEEHGETLEQAAKDFDRWGTWRPSGDPETFNTFEPEKESDRE